MNKTLKTLILIAAALAAVISPSPLIAQEASLSIRENSLFTNGVNLPASPQAWAMNRYGHQDINLYTGAAGYSIPIYTYSDNDFTLPLSIDYSSDGYRPNIQNGPLGLGWNLSIGGAITREVRGIPDDSDTSEGYHFLDKYEGNSLITSSYGSSPEVYGFAYYCEEYDASEYYYDEDLVRSGKLGEEYMPVRHAWERSGSSSYIPTRTCYETMPDIFHFSAPGLKGRFILQPGGKAIFYDTSDSPYGYSVSFTRNRSGFLSFEITTPDKFVYTYAQVDMCTSISQISDTNDNVTTPGSWRLTRIEAPNGRYVSFSYGARNVAQSCQHIRITDYAYLETRDPLPDESGSDSGLTSSSDGVSWSETRSDCLTQVRISNANGMAVCIMDFSYTNGIVERGASPTDCKKLSSITVQNNISIPVRHCSFIYDVIRDPVMSSCGITFLKSVTIDGVGTTSFDYYGNDTDPVGSGTAFPPLTTLSVDWYGYYNPSVTSSTFAPSLQTARNSSSDSWLLSMRQPNLSGTRLGMLRTVTFPTGGSARYEYELNSYSLDLTGLDNSINGTTSGVRVKGVVIKDHDGAELQRRSFSYGDSMRSSGTLLKRPSIYIYYKLRSSGYTCIEHRAVSTTSDLYFGMNQHIEYTATTETISKSGSSESCDIVYGFSTCADGVLGGSYGYGASREYNGAVQNFDCFHIDNDLRVGYQFQAMRAVQDYAGGGKLLGRTEYKRMGGSRVCVRSEGYTYAPFSNPNPVDYTANTFCLSLYTDFTYRFNTPRLTEHSTTEYDLNGNILKMTSQVFSYDSQQRPWNIATTDSEGNTLSTRYFWDNAHKWLLNEKHKYRGGLLMSGMKYTWSRPSPSNRPNWYVPATLSKAAITIVHYGGGEDEEDPWDDTEYEWYQVASFSGFNGAGNPTVVTDALGHETHYSWDTSLLNLASMIRYPSGSSSNGLTTSWTWIPLVGVSKVTHPSGKTERYSYDIYGRLIGISNTENAATNQYGYFISNASNSHSWISSRIYRTESQHADDITFYNGLGYPEQTNIVVGAHDNDIITPYTYDALLRPDKEWLPMPIEDSHGGYNNRVFSQGFQWYENNYNSDRIFSETSYEFCPSGRPLSLVLTLVSTGVTFS